MNINISHQKKKYHDIITTLPDYTMNLHLLKSISPTNKLSEILTSQIQKLTKPLFRFKVNRYSYYTTTTIGGKTKVPSNIQSIFFSFLNIVPFFPTSILLGTILNEIQLDIKYRSFSQWRFGPGFHNMRLVPFARLNP